VDETAAGWAIFLDRGLRAPVFFCRAAKGFARAALLQRVEVRARRFAELVALGGVPALLVALFVATAPSATGAWDFHAFWGAAANIDHGRSPYASLGANAAGTPYPAYLYPPLLAELLTPLGLLPFSAAAVAFVALSIVALAVALRLLEVRDWRCYGMTFLWVPVLHGLRLGTLTPFLVLALAAAWRLRERTVLPALAATLKLFLWPLIVLQRKRFRALAAAAILTLGSWALVGFAGLGAYPSLLRQTQGEWERDGYGIAALAEGRSGLSPDATNVLLLLAALAALTVVVRLGARPALAAGVVVACLASPVSWLHYSTLLLVPIALAQPRLDWAWALPLLLWLTPFEQADGASWRIALWLGVMLAAPALAWRARLAACTVRIHRASTPV
jgi:hypothetical protein